MKGKVGVDAQLSPTSRVLQLKPMRTEVAQDEGCGIEGCNGAADDAVSACLHKPRITGLSAALCSWWSHLLR